MSDNQGFIQGMGSTTNSLTFNSQCTWGMKYILKQWPSMNKLRTNQLLPVTWSQGAIGRWRPVSYYPDIEFCTFFSGHAPISSDLHIVWTFSDIWGAWVCCRSWPDCSIRLRRLAQRTVTVQTRYRQSPQNLLVLGPRLATEGMDWQMTHLQVLLDWQ